MLDLTRELIHVVSEYNVNWDRVKEIIDQNIDSINDFENEHKNLQY